MTHISPCNTLQYVKLNPNNQLLKGHLTGCLPKNTVQSIRESVPIKSRTYFFIIYNFKKRGEIFKRNKNKVQTSLLSLILKKATCLLSLKQSVSCCNRINEARVASLIEKLWISGFGGKSLCIYVRLSVVPKLQASFFFY